MVEMQRTRGIDIFVFHDDNFFVPGHKKNAARFSALADAIEQRGMDPFATLVKARPTDVDPNVFEILRRRLHCIRVYIGIETDADQGLQPCAAGVNPSRTSVRSRWHEVSISILASICSTPARPCSRACKPRGAPAGTISNGTIALRAPSSNASSTLRWAAFTHETSAPTAARLGNCLRRGLFQANSPSPTGIRRGRPNAATRARPRRAGCQRAEHRSIRNF